MIDRSLMHFLKELCGLMHIGRTKRVLKIRIAEHVLNIATGFKDHNVSLHFKLHHGQDPSGLKFWGIDHIKSVWRGCNFGTGAF